MSDKKETISARKYLKSNVKASFIRVGISSVATLIILPFIIDSIGMENYSYISVTSFLVSFSYMFDFGFCRSLVYLVNEKGIEEQRCNQYISTIKIANTLIIVTLFLVGIIALSCQWHILGDSIPSTDKYYLPVAVCALAVMLLSVYNMYQTALLESFFLLDSSAYGVTLKIIFLNATYLINLLTINNLYVYISTPVLANIVATVYYEAIIKRCIRYRYVRPTRLIVNSVVKQALSFTKTGILGSINGALPRLAIIYLTPNLSYIGVLDVITKITASIINLFSTISRPFLALSRVKAQKIRKNFKSILAVYMAFGGLFWIALFLCRRFVVEYFFKNTVVVSNIEILLMIYAAASMFLLIGQPFSLYLQGIGKNESLAKIMVGNILLFVILYFSMNSLGFDLLMNLAIANVLIALYYFASLLFFSVKKSNCNENVVMDK